MAQNIREPASVLAGAGVATGVANWALEHPMHSRYIREPWGNGPGDRRPVHDFAAPRRISGRPTCRRSLTHHHTVAAAASLAAAWAWRECHPGRLGAPCPGQSGPARGRGTCDGDPPPRLPLPPRLVCRRAGRRLGVGSERHAGCAMWVCSQRALPWNTSTRGRSPPPPPAAAATWLSPQGPHHCA